MHKLVVRVARDMSEDRLVEKAANCSWIYCKKMSEDQRPKILIVAESTPVWWSAQAPPLAMSGLRHQLDGCCIVKGLGQQHRTSECY
jgi:hypothetical protein